MAYITLLSDFGLQDASVAIAKGILLQHIPGATIVDITHEVLPFNKKQGAYLLEAVYKNFPMSTIHISIIDIFHGANPCLVLTAFNNQYFFCADNGFLPMLTKDAPVKSWDCLPAGGTHSLHDWLHKAGTIIQSLEHSSPDELDLPTTTLFEAEEKKNDTTGIATCEVIHIDSFGNVVLDITKDAINKIAGNNAQFSLRFIQYEEIKEISTNYTDVKEGIKLCRFNNNGHLEISINKGNAASLFGLQVGGKLNNVQIIFK